MHRAQLTPDSIFSTLKIFPPSGAHILQSTFYLCDVLIFIVALKLKTIFSALPMPPVSLLWLPSVWLGGADTYQTPCVFWNTQSDSFREWASQQLLLFHDVTQSILTIPNATWPSSTVEVAVYTCFIAVETVAIFYTLKYQLGFSSLASIPLQKAACLLSFSSSFARAIICKFSSCCRASSLDTAF